MFVTMAPAAGAIIHHYVSGQAMAYIGFILLGARGVTLVWRAWGM